MQRLQDACKSLRSFPPDFKWIRHAFDIEGYKLHMLYLQSLDQQAKVWPKLLQMQRQGHLPPPLVDEREIKELELFYWNMKQFIGNNTPINAR